MSNMEALQEALEHVKALTLLSRQINIPFYSDHVQRIAGEVQYFIWHEEAKASSTPE